MSQSYATIASPPTGISGNQYTILLNTNLQAIVTKHSGASAPASPQTYQDWLDTSTTPFTWKVYDGADWIVVGYIDATNNRFTPAFDPKNDQTGTTYTIVKEDRNKLLTFNNASSIAVTLPQAGANFPDGWMVMVRNKGAGTVTVTPSTSTINAAASIALAQNTACFIRSDGSNYFTTPIPATFTQVYAGTDDGNYLTSAKMASLWKKGSDIASAATLVRPADASVGGYHFVTGTTNISALWSGEAAGWTIELKFAGILTITHNATSLILPGGKNFTTAADDILRFRSEGSNNWRCVGGSRADGATFGIGRHLVPILAGGLVGSVTNGASAGTVERGTNKTNYRTLDFDTTTQEFACGILPMPNSWDRGTITFRPIWTFESGSGGVVWALQGVAVSDDDPTDVAYGTEQISTDTALTAGDLHRGPESSPITISGSPLAGDSVLFRIKRNVSDGNDTLGVDARLIAIEIYINTLSNLDT